MLKQALMGKMRNTHKILVGKNMKGGNHFEHPGIDKWIILKWNMK
jgi:hypothetical protein